MRYSIVLFGESEKGQFQRLHFIDTLLQFVDTFGNPPGDTQGIPLATQALLLEKGVIFIRVQEEGFSHNDYLYGFHLLKNQDTPPAALCLPGVGDITLLDTALDLCKQLPAFLITTEKDFYDFLSAH